MYLNLIFYIYQFTSKTFIDFIPKKEIIYDDNNFDDIKYIAHGAYGDIYSAYSKSDKIYLCLKHINTNKMKKHYQELGFTKSYENDLNNEIKLLKIFSPCENSVKYYGNYDNKDEKIIILEK